MANLRTFKKDVIFLVNEVISDCWVFMYLNRDKNVDEANKIVADAVRIREVLVNILGNAEKCCTVTGAKALKYAQEEDIAKAVWVAKSSLPPFLLNTYPSIAEVFKEAKV